MTAIRGVEIRLHDRVSEVIFAINRVAGRAAYGAGLTLGDTYELALLKKSCEAYLALPLVQALSTEDLPDV